MRGMAAMFAVGLFLQSGGDFRVRLENALDAPTLIHWHGLTPHTARTACRTCRNP